MFQRIFFHSFKRYLARSYIHVMDIVGSKYKKQPCWHGASMLSIPLLSVRDKADTH